MFKHILFRACPIINFEMLYQGIFCYELLHIKKYSLVIYVLDAKNYIICLSLIMNEQTICS
jgi:hypothetical protein